jgi:hypothetical protein
VYFASKPPRCPNIGWLLSKASA